jgi:hypothetical protein
LPSVKVGSRGRLEAMTDRPLIPASVLRTLPAAADDGTPYCSPCRRYGELNLMVADGDDGALQCEAWSLPVYAEADRPRLPHDDLRGGAGRDAGLCSDLLPPRRTTQPVNSNNPNWHTV